MGGWSDGQRSDQDSSGWDAGATGGVGSAQSARAVEDAVRYVLTGEKRLEAPPQPERVTPSEGAAGIRLSGPWERDL